jgi:purine-nucleoside phosphorylase
MTENTPLSYFDQVQEAAAFLRGKLGKFRPRVGMVLGSGLGDAAEGVTQPVIIPYGSIPHFPESTVQGHSGCIVAGMMGGAPVLVMQGRVHFYEGYTPWQVTFPMRVLGAMGIGAVILTNAAGAIDENLRLGQLVLITDHINMMGWNPLVGPNEPRFAIRPDAGLRFFDMSEPYSPWIRGLAKDIATTEGFDLGEGIYLAVSGPSFETPAEIRAYRTLGAQLVGMSTVPETIVARHMGMEVLAVSCVTNQAAGLSPTPLSHQEVFKTGQQVRWRLRRLLEQLAPGITSLLEANL